MDIETRGTRHMTKQTIIKLITRHNVTHLNGKRATLEFKQNKRGEWFWTLTATNGKQIATCAPEFYKNKMSCVKNVMDILFVKWSVEESEYNYGLRISNISKEL